MIVGINRQSEKLWQRLKKTKYGPMLWALAINYWEKTSINQTREGEGEEE
jgi:hypothetical protein